MESVWQSLIPDSLLFDIFSFLHIKELGRAAQVCTDWKRVASDEFLWQQLARRTWNIKGCLAPGKASWHSEVKRLSYHVPVICSESIVEHTDEVLDVSISHSGKYFCTCSKDALIIMWELGPGRNSTRVRSFNAGKYLKWELSQYSTFCPDDSLILICGIKGYDYIPVDAFDYKAGVGAVFTVPDLKLVTMVQIDPPTMFGSWLNERIFLGGWTGTNDNSVNIHAYQVFDHQISNPMIDQSSETPDADSEISDLNYNRSWHRLFSFQGNRYHLMNLLVANVHGCQCNDPGPHGRSRSFEFEPGRNSKKRTPQFDEDLDLPDARKVKIVNLTCDAGSQAENLKHTSEDVPMQQSGDIIRTKNSSVSEKSLCSKDEEIVPVCDSSTFPDKTSTTGSICSSAENNMARKIDDNASDCLPHSGVFLHHGEQAACKICGTNIRCRQFVAFVTCHHDVIAVQEVTKEHLDDVMRDRVQQVIPNDNMEDVREKTDKIDYTFYIKDSYITGLCLSHDQRYLYFNYREKDKNALQNQVDDDEELPIEETVFCKDIKIGSVDLVTMEIMKDFVLKGHEGYSSFPAWYICLNASPDYVGSGSEDMRGYIWDRHYGICIGRLFHSSVDTGSNTLFVLSMHESSVVNGIAFSPLDQETCITVCDDRLIKVWRSRHRMKTLLDTEKKLATKMYKKKFQYILESADKLKDIVSMSD